MSLISVDLDATWNEPTGTVTLAVTVIDGSPMAAHSWSLVRSDVLGSADVRVQDGQDLSGDGITGTYLMVVTDHECALAGLVTYTLRVEDETMNVGYAEASVTPDTARRWLTFPVLPQYSLELPPVGGVEIDHEPRDRYFEPIDRDEFLPVYGAFGSRRGRLGILAPDFDTAVEIVNAYKRIRTALLRLPDPAGASMYHSLARINLRKYTDRAHEWLISGEYRQVPRPSGPLLGTLGWSYADTTALGETYSASAVTFPTYVDRTLGVS